MTGRPAPRPNGDPTSPTPPPREAVQRWRLTLARAAVGDLQQRDQLAAWEAALAGSGLPLAGLDLATPRPRFAIAAPLGGSIPGEAELADVWLVERLPGWRVREALDGRLPAGYRLVDLFDVWLGEPALPGQVGASVYRAELAVDGAQTGILHAAAEALLAAAELPRSRRKGESTVDYDLRPFVDALEVVAGPGAGVVSVRMTLRHDPEKGIGRPEEVLGELGDRVGSPLAVDRLVREGLVLRERPSELPPRARTPGRGRR